MPWHGPLRRGEEVRALPDDLAEYAAFVDAVAREHPQGGHTPLEAATAEKYNRFASWQENKRLVGNLHRRAPGLLRDDAARVVRSLQHS